MTNIGQELYERLGPWYRRDLDIPTHPLLDLAEACIGGLQALEDLIRDDDDGPGWSKIMDPDRAPREWLPWLAQFNGRRIPQGLTEQAERDYIKGVGQTHMGTPAAIVAAAQQRLTGTRTVFLSERSGSAYRFQVATVTSETPDPVATEKDIRAEKPAGLVMTYSTVDGDDYATLAATHTDYNQIASLYTYYYEIPLEPDRV
jgi:hypothetical protein